MAEPRYAIGVDLGGTFIKGGVVDERGNILHRTRTETGAEKGLDALISNIARAAEAALGGTGINWERICGVGVGSPGVFDFKKGVLVFAPNLSCLNHTRPAHLVKAKLKRKVDVFLENDANCAALAENWAGSGKRASSLVLFTLGTGIGSGVIMDGKILHGSRGMAAELGHQTIFPNGRYVCGCGNRGCLEAYASAEATARRFRDAVKEGRASRLADAVLRGEDVTSEEIWKAARKGDELSLEIMRETGTILGIAVANLINILDPEVILFAGGLAAAGDMLLRPIIEEADRRTYGPKLEGVTIGFGRLGNDAGLIGAAACAFNRSGISA